MCPMPRATHSLVITTAQLQLAEEVYFLGFPYGLWFDVGELNAGFPMPLVKRATVSAMYTESGWMLLDGHNNPGFSGGPVVRRWNGREQVVVGVVSGYRSETSRVVDGSGNPGPYSYVMNTGIVVVYDSRKLQSRPQGEEAGRRRAGRGRPSRAGPRCPHRTVGAVILPENSLHGWGLGAERGQIGVQV